MTESPFEEEKIRTIIKEEIDNYFTTAPTWFWGYNLNRLAWFRAGMESVEFVEKYLYQANQAKERLEHLSYCCSLIDIKGLVLEFGVGHRGESTQILAHYLPTVYGFDSFRGLPENWDNVLPKGTYYNYGKAPDHLGDNVVFVKGLFQKTLSPFLEKHPEPCAFIHIDCDIYSSTKVIFQKLNDRIIPGTIIAFDEFFNYPRWKHHEYKAWQEFA